MYLPSRLRNCLWIVDLPVIGQYWQCCLGPSSFFLSLVSHCSRKQIGKCRRGLVRRKALKGGCWELRNFDIGKFGQATLREVEAMGRILVSLIISFYEPVGDQLRRDLVIFCLSSVWISTYLKAEGYSTSI